MNGRLKNWLEGGALVLLPELVLVAALAASAAYWTWVFASPKSLASPSARAPLAPGVAERPAARALFGTPGKAAAAAAAAPSASVRLVGVVAPGGRRGGRAIFAVEGGKPVTARPGEQIVPGVVLKEVRPHHARVERNGISESIPLERKAAAVPDDEPRARRNGGG